jgi:L-threonylcarbamoyladenylate synthase
MLTIAVDSARPDEALIARAADLLRAGAVVAYPTDTLYGLAADPTSVHAVEQLYRIKGRRGDQAIPLIAADLAQVERLAGPLPDNVRRLGERFWPGPLTLIVPAWPALAPGLLGIGRTVAVRVPAHAVARALSRAFGGPITSTSANRSGQEPFNSPDGVRTALDPDLEAIVDGGPSPGGPPSTIVDACAGRPRLVRAGAVPFERVLECLL